MVTYFGSWWYDYVTCGRIYIRYHFTRCCWSRSYYLYLSIACSRYISVDLRLIQYIGYCLRCSIGWRIYSGWYSSRVKLYLVLHHYFSSSFAGFVSLSLLCNLIFHLMYTSRCIGCYLYLTGSGIYIYTRVGGSCLSDSYHIGINISTSTELIVSEYIHRGSIILLHYFFRIGTFHWVCSEVIIVGNGGIASCYSDWKGYFPCAGLWCYLIT